MHAEPYTKIVKELPRMLLRRRNTKGRIDKRQSLHALNHAGTNMLQKNHRKTIADVRAMGTSTISESRITVSPSTGALCQRFMIGTSEGESAGE